MSTGEKMALITMKLESCRTGEEDSRTATAAAAAASAAAAAPTAEQFLKRQM